ncbi:MAG: hypothetical protein QOF49_1987 [Chloroflexota bacterium]|nr:hypothetical protein [Chloroflexota bacterium]
MQSIAAYYVLVATDVIADQTATTRRRAVQHRRPSLFARLGAFLDGLSRPGRRSTTQPA